MALVPINPRVLSWAVSESGYSRSDIDAHLKIEEGTVERWIEGEGQPNQTQFKKPKLKLKRPAAIFFMDEPPSTTESTVAMRFAFGSSGQSSDRTPKERIAIRDATRIGGFIGDIQRDLGRLSDEPFYFSLNEDARDTGERVRNQLFDVSIEEQMEWNTPAIAFREWRKRVEKLGIMVFRYSLGSESCRGFALAENRSPVIGINTHWNASVRVYTLFHELGHVLTKTSSSCQENSSNLKPTTDPVERWCESFAASALMPEAVFNILASQRQGHDALATAGWLAIKLKVSRKAALLRLIEVGKAEWQDFKSLSPKYETNSSGGGESQAKKRTRSVIRLETYGSCLLDVRTAYERDLVGEMDIRSYLLMYPSELPIGTV